MMKGKFNLFLAILNMICCGWYLIIPPDVDLVWKIFVVTINAFSILVQIIIVDWANGGWERKANTEVRER